MTPWVCSDCIDTSVLIRCTIATTTQASFHFLCRWLFSHSQPLIHVIVFSRQRGTITPHKHPIIIKLKRGVWDVTVSCYRKKHCNNKHSFVCYRLFLPGVTLTMQNLSTFCLKLSVSVDCVNSELHLWCIWKQCCCQRDTTLLRSTYLVRSENCKSKLSVTFPLSALEGLIASWHLEGAWSTISKSL